VSLQQMNESVYNGGNHSFQFDVVTLLTLYPVSAINVSSCEEMLSLFSRITVISREATAVDNKPIRMLSQQIDT